VKKFIIFALILCSIAGIIFTARFIIAKINDTTIIEGSEQPDYYIEDETTTNHVNKIQNLTFNIPDGFTKDEEASASLIETYRNNNDYNSIITENDTNIYEQMDQYNGTETEYKGLFGLAYEKPSEYGFIFSDGEKTYYVSASSKDLLQTVLTNVQ
jgi:hypothetical protein